MKRLWSGRSLFFKLVFGLGGIHLAEDTLEDVLLVTIARFAPVPVWALYLIILILSLTFLAAFTYLMARYAYRFTRKD